jgi:hypothetical protein
MGQKAEAFADYAKSLGWKAEIKEDGPKSTVKASREGWTLSISWRGEACLNETVLEHGDGSRKIRNAGAARRHLEELAGEPTRDDGGHPGYDRPAPKARKSSATARKARKPKPEPVTPIETKPRLAKRVPFDLETATDEEVLKAVVGKKIIWRNVLAARYEEARVMDRPDQKHLRIVVNRRNERCLTWCAVEENVPLGQDYRGPFRSVKLASIIQIR